MRGPPGTSTAAIACATRLGSDRLAQQRGARDHLVEPRDQVADAGHGPRHELLEAFRGQPHAPARGAIAQDRAARLQVRWLDARDQARGHARAQLGVESVELDGCAIGAEHHRSAGREQVVERVEQLDLRGLLAGQELHVLEDQHVGAAPVALPHALHLARADRLRDLAGELLARAIERRAAQRRADRAAQVRLSQPAHRVQEQRAAAPRVAARHRARCLERERVARTRDEGLEALGRRLRPRLGLGASRRALARRPAARRAAASRAVTSYSIAAPLRRDALQHFPVALANPVPAEPVRAADHDPLILHLALERPEPCVVRPRPDLLPDPGAHDVPPPWISHPGSIPPEFPQNPLEMRGRRASYSRCPGRTISGIPGSGFA